MASLLWTVLLVCLAVSCVKSANVGTNCANNGECTNTVDNSYCDTTCKCKTGSTVNDANTACTINDGSIGGTCDADNPCPASASCSTTCSCLTKSTVDATDLTKCNVEEDYIGGACASSNPCSTVSNSECSTNKCQCKAGYVMKTGNLAVCEVAKEKVGRACTTNTADAECGTTTNLECTGNTNTQCVCKSGYTGSEGGACSEIGAKKVGKLCSPTSSPEDDAVCGPPATTFLECTGNSKTECACKSGYTGEKNGVCTKKSDSGAAGLVGSMVTVLLAAVLHVFMRD